MSLTRKMLKAMGIEDDKIDQIIDAHTETVDGLKDSLKSAVEKAENYDALQKELDALKSNAGDDWKAKYEKEKKDFDAYKADITAKEAKTAKEAAAKAYFEGKNITGANLEIAMRGASAEIAGIELDEGKIKNTAALDELVNGTFAGLVVTKTVQGAQTATPPANTGSSRVTKADLYKKDDHGRYIMSTAERQKALAENPDLMTGRKD